jgi:hypothetical protein
MIEKSGAPKPYDPKLSVNNIILNPKIAHFG